MTQSFHTPLRRFIGGPNILACGSFHNWLRALWLYGGFEPQYLPRALSVSMIALLTAPLRCFERLKLAGAIESTEITESPVFIIGHPRSGTTYFHTLMSQDTNFGIVTSLQAFLPELFLFSWLTEPIVSRLIPQTRVMDNVKVALQSPAEEEMALVNLSPYYIYYSAVFAKRWQSILDNAILSHETNLPLIQHWKEVYLHFLKKVTLFNSGQPLLLKNPMNTGRVKQLLELFPDAKFIHIFRNPYTVYQSSKKLYRNRCLEEQLQTISEADIEQKTLVTYEKLMHCFFRDKSLIPEGHLVEVQFETFEATPLQEVERVYGELDLKLSASAKQKMAQHISSVSDYQKNAYQASPRDLELINHRWGFAIEALGYCFQESH